MVPMRASALTLVADINARSMPPCARPQSQRAAAGSITVPSTCASRVTDQPVVERAAQTSAALCRLPMCTCIHVAGVGWCVSHVILTEILSHIECGEPACASEGMANSGILTPSGHRSHRERLVGAAARVLIPACGCRRKLDEAAMFCRHVVGAIAPPERRSRVYVRFASRACFLLPPPRFRLRRWSACWSSTLAMGSCARPRGTRI